MSWFRNVTPPSFAAFSTVFARKGHPSRTRRATRWTPCDRTRQTFFRDDASVYQSPVPLTFPCHFVSSNKTRRRISCCFLTMRTYVTVTYDMRGATQDAKSTSPITAIAAIAYIAKPTKTAETQEKRTLHAHRVHDPGRIRRSTRRRIHLLLLTERIKRTGEHRDRGTQNRSGPVDQGDDRRIPQERALRGQRPDRVRHRQGDAVTLFSTTRYEWGVLDFALAAIGAVNVPIYDTDSAAQAERILNDSNVKLAIADDRERFDRLDSVIGRCPSLKHILMLDANAMGALEDWASPCPTKSWTSVSRRCVPTIWPPSCTRPVPQGHRRVPSCRIAISCRSRVPAALRCTR